ncbi:MAG TPA: hypothetical protein DEO93_06825 [Stenotrophomonas sp.]|nr:hypothetical protein [Stenotrophomonas sp.]
MNSVAIRRAALVLAAMQAPVRERLLDSLPPDLRANVDSAVHEVTQRGWNTRVLALQQLAQSDATPAAVSDYTAVPPVFALASQLQPGEFARVLQATGLQEQDFLLSLLDPPVSIQVRQEMARLAPMPVVVREATLAAADRLLATLQGVG